MNTVMRVDELACEHNLSLFKLAQLSGVAYSTLRNAKTRGTQLSVDTIECICKCLGISLAQFFSECNGDASGHILEGQLSLSEML